MILKKNRGHILVIDDEEDIRELLKFNLENEGYSVSSVATGEEALDSVRKLFPDLIILDLMLPGIDGLEVCKKIKSDEQLQHIPVLMLTAKSEETDEVIGLELGADDYLTKPFSPRILIARLKSLIRRKSPKHESGPGIIRIENMTIDPIRFEIKIDGNPVILTYTEFSLLHYLAQRPGWVYSRYQIVDALKGEDYIVTERSVDVQIVGLRKKLGANAKFIETVRGVGYRFKSLD